MNNCWEKAKYVGKMMGGKFRGGAELFACQGGKF